LACAFNQFFFKFILPQALLSATPPLISAYDVASFCNSPQECETQLNKTFGIWEGFSLNETEIKNQADILEKSVWEIYNSKYQTIRFNPDYAPKNIWIDSTETLGIHELKANISQLSAAMNEFKNVAVKSILNFVENLKTDLRNSTLNVTTQINQLCTEFQKSTLDLSAKARGCLSSYVSQSSNLAQITCKKLVKTIDDALKNVSYTYEGRYRQTQNFKGKDGILRWIKEKIEKLFNFRYFSICITDDPERCPENVINFTLNYPVLKKSGVSYHIYTPR
jgi:hypothetical protein